MAQSRINVVAFVLAAMVILAVTASAQEPSVAPSPTPDAGAGFALPMSSAFVASSLLLSVFGLLGIRRLWIVFTGELCD